VGAFRSYNPEIQEYLCNSFNYPTLAYTTLTKHHLGDMNSDSQKASNDANGKPTLPTVRKGWMMKEGHIVKNWKKRHFVLEEGVLIYYEDESCSNEKGRLRVKDFHVTYTSGRPTFNMLANHPSEKSFSLEAADWNDSIAWRKALVANGLLVMGKMEE